MEYGLQNVNHLLSGAQVSTNPNWGRYTDEQRVAWMREYLINEQGSDPRLRWHTTDILRSAGIATRDLPAQAAALLKYVQTAIYYVNERDEQLQTPWRTIESRSGDCDDFAILLAALAESIGMPNRLVLIGRDGKGKMIRWVEGTKMSRTQKKAQWFHITTDLGWPFGNPTTWAPTEPTMRDAPLGYDTVLHGVQIDREGRLYLPVALGGPKVENAASMGGGTQFLGAMGVVDEFSWKGYAQELSLNAFQAVVTAGAVYVAMNYLEKDKR